MTVNFETFQVVRVISSETVFGAPGSPGRRTVQEVGAAKRGSALSRDIQESPVFTQAQPISL